MLRIASVTLDSRNVQVLTHFWSEALGYKIAADGPDDGAVEDPRDRDVELVFISVPEPRSVKNRAHLDIGADDVKAEFRRLTDLGATVCEVLPRWTVMANPEGNEFCVCMTSADDPISWWRT